MTKITELKGANTQRSGNLRKITQLNNVRTTEDRQLDKDHKVQTRKTEKLDNFPKI